MRKIQGMMFNLPFSRAAADCYYEAVSVDVYKAHDLVLKRMG